MSQPPNKRVSKTDNYSTPKWAVHALLDRVEFRGKIWEPAAGEGNIVEVLRERGHKVIGSDIRSMDGRWKEKDFLQVEGRTSASIITNPPYKDAEAFVRNALELTSESGASVAMLLRLQFLEGQKRYYLFKEHPFTKMLVFSRRLAMYPEGHEGKKGGGTVPYAWFVWGQGEDNQVEWIL